MSNSGYTCLRYIFCWLNILLWITGCVVLGAGVYLKIAYEGYATLVPQYALLSADWLAILVGIVAFVLASLGCCGSWFQVRWILITYFSLVVFMFLIEFVIACLAFVFRESISHTLKQELQDGIAHHYNVTTSQESDNFVTIWDHIHTQFECCGVKNYEDWFMIDAWPTEKWVPNSCCDPNKGIVNDFCGRLYQPDKWYTKGCSHQIQMWFVQRLHIVGVVGLFVAFIQLFGLISSMLLFCTVKHKRMTHTYKSYDPHS